MVIKCVGCWQEYPKCSCGPYGTSPVTDAFFVMVELPHDVPIAPKSTARRLHDAKVLENNQRLKNLEDMENGKNK